MATGIPVPGGDSDTAVPDAVTSFPQEPAYWRELLRDSARPRLGAALYGLLTSVGGYLDFETAVYQSLRVPVAA